MCVCVCEIIMYPSLVYSGCLQAMFLLHTAVEVEDLVENSQLSSHSSAAAVALDGTYSIIHKTIVCVFTVPTN